MAQQNFFYKCSIEYINSIHQTLYRGISSIIACLPKRGTRIKGWPHYANKPGFR